MSRDRTRWAPLTPERHAVAADLTRQAEALLADSPELTSAEAIDIAAIQHGYAIDNHSPDSTAIPDRPESRNP